MTERHAILSGSTFEEQIGYARAVVDGDWVHVSGTTGFDYTTMTISDDVVVQAEQCLRNIEAALAEAECSFADVVRVRYLLPDREDFEPCWPVLRRCFGDVQPAATMLVCGLADPRMKIEIEVYARRRTLPHGGAMSEHSVAPVVPVEAYEPPYYVAVFTTVRTPDQSGYSETNARMEELVRDVPGYLGMDHAQTPGGLGITVGYFRDADALTRWRTDVEHRAAQQRGRAEWYQSYTLHVAKVERSHGFTRAGIP
ncbi:putative endoribonuclease [Streptomyces hygroscopicus subsp. jinggangensis 5008]|nr:putative endoribonuclease [Streptomyces hygroscopicus subsp. jinggangensis 5008]AGF67968.1 putative endoribonuclease [Streptomyces hygroscopicus subsp. jinggangensis TL01]